ncbi:sigma-70 family RNA polymerase sigma factor [Pseudomonas proteolytica]|uniref:sigma-70 family RNA polymerase sigma factor n=1 Tax=Pseudomonas proteolytica TaxID=219574 RepID=UPI0023DF908E|nr:sigma-70 family RNA polymerase sigma factor [Pseudomonas proteolytica]MDF3160679.1 sigma-70 family RNA polymerase sigma factor [Pseudomonas proteolytica]
MSGRHPIEHLYVQHHCWLRGWLNLRLNNAADAADLAQDTFVRVLQRRHAQALLEPRAYLRTIARGLVVDLWRRRDVERAWLETLAHLPEAEVPSPETSALAIESLIAIDQILDELPQRAREAFLLAQLEGMTCPRIAERLGVSLSTVERDIAMALRNCYRLSFEINP